MKTPVAFWGRLALSLTLLILSMRNLRQTSQKDNHEIKKEGISAISVAEKGAPRDVPKRSSWLGRFVTSIELGVPCSNEHVSTETGHVNAVVSSEGVIAWLSFREHSTILAGSIAFYESFHNNHLKGLDAPARHSQKRHVAEPCDLNHRSARTLITKMASPSWRPLS